MVTACANPGCGKPFRFLNQGRLFHLPTEKRGKPAMEHFWLCSTCAARLTLTRQGQEVAVIDGETVVAAITQGVSG